MSPQCLPKHHVTMLFGIVFGCCCRRLSQHGVVAGCFFLCLRWQWIVLSRLGVALLSFVLVSWCVVCFWAPPLRPTRLLTRQLCGPGCVCRPEFSIIRLKNKQCSTLVDNALSVNSPHVTVCVQCAHTCCTRPCPRLLCPFTRCVSVRSLVLFTCGWGSCAAWSLDFNLRTRFVVAFLVLFVCWFKLV